MRNTHDSARIGQSYSLTALIHANKLHAPVIAPINPVGIEIRGEPVSGPGGDKWKVFFPL
jgi:hypothetical protein